jgi:CBS domain-containing protein
MKVEMLMTGDVACCETGASIREVADTMRETDRGAIPVVDRERRLVGIVTDRDLVVRLAAKASPGWDESVTTVMTPDPASCRPTESVHHALDVMKSGGVARLPVVDDDGVVVGILSIHDVVLGAQNVRAGQARVSYEQVMETLLALCAARVGAQSAVQASAARG